MRTVEHAVDIGRPVREVWDAWTRFERFPRFVGSVRDLSPDPSHPDRRVGPPDDGEGREPAVTVRVHGRRISWRTLRGLPNSGVITFEGLADDRTRLTLRLEYSPEWFAERGAGTEDLFEQRVRSDLDRFRRIVERTD